MDRTKGSRALVWGIAAFMTVAFMPGSAAATSGEASSEVRDAVAAEARFPQFARVLDSRRVSSPVMLHGGLRDTAGRPVAEATILLAGWPSVESRRAMPVGSEFSIAPIARTVTDGQGRFTLRSEQTALLRMREASDGLDLELNVFAGGRHLVYFSQVSHDSESGGWQIPGILPKDDQQVSRGTTAMNRLDVVLDTHDGSSTLNDAIAPGSVAVPRHHQGSGCSAWKSLPRKVGRETVATAMAKNGVTITAKYTSSATTTSGLGMSYNGGVSFSQSGTRSRTSNFKAGFYDRKAGSGSEIHREYRVDWRHFVHERHCSTDALFPDKYQVQVATDPDIVTGGGGDFSSRYSSFTCSSGRTAPANFKSVSTENATAKTYGSAFSINPVGKGSFSGTARSGYNSSTRITFIFDGTSGGKWCGDTDYPTAKYQRVRAYR